MSGLQMIQTNEVRIYNLTAGRAVPRWLTDKKRRALLKKDVDLRRRVELIQDFEMPVATTHLCESRDGSYIFAAGIYKPRVRCFETDQLSMKFERHLNCEVVAMESLSDDYTKIAFLMADRTVELHAAYGFHFRARVPKFGRTLAFHHPNCDLYVGGSSPDVYRLNLDQGRFLRPISTAGTEVNIVKLNEKYGMLGVGTVEGVVECFDPRTRDSVGSIDIASALPRETLQGSVPEVTCLSFFEDGLTMAAGTSSGHVLLYDVRTNQPTVVKDHYYGLPIKQVFQHQVSGKVMSADQKGLKFWDKHDGTNFTTVEPPADIHDVCQIKGSGLVTVATESPKIQSYFIPDLGPAPKWCSYLDNITDELEEDGQPAVYDDYKFVTRDELDTLGLAHLIGTSLLRGYMHGFFMDIRLYNKAKEVANPFAYDEYRKDKIQEKLREGTASRLELAKYRKQLPKINKSLAKKLLHQQEKKREQLKDEADGAEETQLNPKNPLGDDRFKAMFNNADFEVDMESHEYKLLHPQGWKMRSDLVLDEKFDALEDISESSEEEGRPSEEEESDAEESAAAVRAADEKAKSAPKRKPQLYALKTGEELQPLQPLEKRKKAKRKTFADMVVAPETEDDRIISGPGGKTMKLTVKAPVADKGAAAQAGGAPRPHTKDRRGVRELGLARKPKQFWRGKPVK